MTLRLPVPGLGKAVPAGDLVKSITESVGIRPCGGCERRRRWLNERVQFVPWGGYRGEQEDYRPDTWTD